MKKFLIATLLTAALFLGVASVASANGHSCYQERCHVVHYGETLFSIGRHYDVNPYHIAEANNLYNPNHIYAGQVLYIPHGSRYPWHAGSGCGYNDCGHQGYQKSSYHYDSGCGYNDCYDKCDYGNCYNSYDNCGSGCNSGYYGYDYTGYYYGSYQKQYSHTCGYNSNCW